jgi:hypothetical protein
VHDRETGELGSTREKHAIGKADECLRSRLGDRPT